MGLWQHLAMADWRTVDPVTQRKRGERILEDWRVVPGAAARMAVTAPGTLEPGAMCHERPRLIHYDVGRIFLALDPVSLGEDRHNTA